MDWNNKILQYEGGIIQFLKDHNLKFNPRPFSNPKHLMVSSQMVEVKSDKFVDFHLEIAQKVDALIAASEQEQKMPEISDEPNTMFMDYETTVLNPLKQELMQRYSLWLA